MNEDLILKMPEERWSVGKVVVVQEVGIRSNDRIKHGAKIVWETPGSTLALASLALVLHNDIRVVVLFQRK